MTEWIKCSERLPDNFINCLAYDPKHSCVTIGCFCLDIKSKIVFDPENTRLFKYTPSHWAELPEVPKDDI